MAEPTFKRWMGALWLYTLLLYAIGVNGVLAALIAAVLSVLISYVVLARPRAAVTHNIEARLNARRDRTEDLNAKLQGDDD